MAHICKDRVYYHYVFMLRNSDDDYDIPPTVVATTSNIEEAVDILLDAEQYVYNEKKVGILRAMNTSELYMVNDDVFVWKTQSRNQRLVIWNLRQYLDRRIEDEFMSVWKSYRRYVDYCENGFENDMELIDIEKNLLRVHMPYNDIEFQEAEMTIAEMDELADEEETPYIEQYPRQLKRVRHSMIEDDNVDEDAYSNLVKQFKESRLGSVRWGDDL